MAIPSFVVQDLPADVNPSFDTYIRTLRHYAKQYQSFEVAKKELQEKREDFKKKQDEKDDAWARLKIAQDIFIEQMKSGAMSIANP
jgi:hypothetical protein